jgi:hypothetical protein
MIGAHHPSNASELQIVQKDAGRLDIDFKPVVKLFTPTGLRAGGSPLCKAPFPTRPIRCHTSHVHPHYDTARRRTPERAALSDSEG